MFTITSGSTKVLTAHAFDGDHNEVTDTVFTWGSSSTPSDLVVFADTNASATTGNPVTLRSQGPTGTGTVVVTTSNGVTTQESFTVTGGEVTSVTITAS